MDVYVEGKLRRGLRVLKLNAAMGIAFTLLSFGAFMVTLITGQPMWMLLVVAVALGATTMAYKYAHDALWNGKRGGWIAAIILCTLQFGSLLMFPLGIYGLSGLLAKEVRDHFLIQDPLNDKRFQAT